MKLMLVFQTGCYSIALLIICSFKTLFNKATWYVIFLRWLCLRVKHIRVLDCCACIHRCLLILVSHSSTLYFLIQNSKKQMMPSPFMPLGKNFLALAEFNENLGVLIYQLHEIFMRYSCEIFTDISDILLSPSTLSYLSCSGAIGVIDEMWMSCV